MSTTIIYAHPYEKSFNAAILAEVSQQLAAKNEAFQVLDLCADGFNPAYTKAELALYKEGKTGDPLVQKYQQALRQSSRVIYIFPIWWGEAPAIIKGFSDKVFAKDFAYSQNPKNGMTKGLLTHIQQALIITTSTAPTLIVKLFFGNAISRVFSGYTLKSVGIKQRKWLNCGRVNLCSQEQRQAFLASLGKHI